MHDALGCRFKVVAGVSTVCQVSQLYAAIDDLATRELGSMMPSLFTLQAFYFSFLMCDMCAKVPLFFSNLYSIYVGHNTFLYFCLLLHISLAARAHVD